MTPELWVSLAIGIFGLISGTWASVVAYKTSKRPASQINNDDQNSLKTMSETQERLVVQNARIMAQNEEILSRLNGSVDVNGRFDMRVLMEDGEAPLTGVVRTFRAAPVEHTAS